jgi:hypothetical protein
MWIRRDNAFDAIIAPEIFAKAQKILARRRYRLSDQEALDRLAKLWRRKGRFSDKIISAANGVPSSSSYIARFGSLAVAYRLISLQFNRRYHVKTSPVVRAVHGRTVGELVANVERFGGSATFNEQDRLLTVDQRLKVSIRVAHPSSEGVARAKRWPLLKSKPTESDLTSVVRLDDSKSKAQDYYLLPTDRLPRSRDRQLRMSIRVFAEIYRYDSPRCVLPDLCRTIFDQAKRSAPAHPSQARSPHSVCNQENPCLSNQVTPVATTANKALPQKYERGRAALSERR